MTTSKPKDTLTITLKISAVIEPDEGGYHGYCPALRGLHVDGATQKETLNNLKDAITVYLTSLSKHGDPLPIGPDLMVSVVRPNIPDKAILRNLTVEWHPSLQMCGVS